MSLTSEAIDLQTRELSKIMKKNEIFDPRIIDKTDDKRLWCTESVELANKGINEGYKLKDYPYLRTVKDANLRKANLAFKYSEEELEVIETCAGDIYFFSDNFGKLKDEDKGWVNVKLRDYQRNLLNFYDENRWNIVMFPRQSGKTTTTIMKIVHFLTFNIEKDCVVVAQSDKVVTEILQKIKHAFEGLPFFLQPGFVSFNKNGFVLDNGCRLSIGVASESVVQGFSLDLLFIDEFAYIPNSMVNKFWMNIYPSLSNNPNSRCIITSTPNGRNKFYELWTGAINGMNKFHPYRIYWQDVPRKESLEEFKNTTIQAIGIEGWEMGFECSFDTTLKSIFTSGIQKKLREDQRLHERMWSRKNCFLGDLFDMEFISKNVVDYDIRKDYFLMSIDIGEGLSQDYTTLKLRKVDWNIEKQRLEFVSVGVYYDNEISVEDFAEMVMRFSNFFDKNKIRIVVENNTYGGEFFAHIKGLKLSDESYSWFDNHVFAKFSRKSKGEYEYGIRWDSYNKKLAVKTFSNLVTKGILNETHQVTIEEYLNFGKQKGTGSYAAQYGHDDLVMADVTMSWFIKSKDIFAVSYFREAESYLREVKNDIPIHILKQREEEERKQRNKYTDNYGFVLRNHEEEYNKQHARDVCIMM